MSSEVFVGAEGFCPDCGCILPVLTSMGGIQCYSCKHVFDAQILGKMESTYTVWFNSRKSRTDGKIKKKKPKSEAEGPIVERKCSKCGNDKMTYTTLQLRSADEGQTVFYTCTNCHHKETENS